MDRTWIKQKLKDAGKSQRDLAAAWGVTEGALSSFLTKEGDLTMKQAVSLADLLDMTLTEIAANLGLVAPPSFPEVSPTKRRLLSIDHDEEPEPDYPDLPDLPIGRWSADSLPNGAIHLKASVIVPPHEAKPTIERVMRWASLRPKSSA